MVSEVHGIPKMDRNTVLRIEDPNKGHSTVLYVVPSQVLYVPLSVESNRVVSTSNVEHRTR